MKAPACPAAGSPQSSAGTSHASLASRQVRSSRARKTYAWASKAGVDPDGLIAQRMRALAEYSTWRQQGTGAAKQASIGHLERASARIAKFQPLLIPSQIRTAEYAAEVLRLPLGPMTWGLDDAGVTAMVAAQMERQKILTEPGRRFQVVILEAGLGVRLVSRAAMAGQLGRLLAVSSLPALDFGIISADSHVPVLPLSSFVIFDDHLVSIETITGEQRISDPDEVKAYQKAFGLLSNAAVSGREAGDLIRAALARLAD